MTNRMIAAKPKSRIGPRQHGQKMTLKAFEFVHGEDGYIYELAGGYIVASELANCFHSMQILAITRLLHLYHALHPSAIHAVLGGMECKLIIPARDS